MLSVVMLCIGMLSVVMSSAFVLIVVSPSLKLARQSTRKQNSQALSKSGCIKTFYVLKLFTTVIVSYWQNIALISTWTTQTGIIIAEQVKNGLKIDRFIATEQPFVVQWLIS